MLEILQTMQATQIANANGGVNNGGNHGGNYSNGVNRNEGNDGGNNELKITIHVADATKGPWMMRHSRVRTSPSIVTCTGRAITHQMIVTGARPATGTQQHLQIKWVVRMRFAIREMRNDDGRPS